MASLFCSVSGNPLINGVISSKTGHLYERSLIHKYLAAFGCCPHTGVPLTEEDLVQLRGSAHVVLPQQTSIEDNITKLQKEFDVLLLEVSTTAETLTKEKRALALALYQYEASVRVVAKLKAQNQTLKPKIAGLVEAVKKKESL